MPDDRKAATAPPPRPQIPVAIALGSPAHLRRLERSTTVGGSFIQLDQSAGAVNGEQQQERAGVMGRGTNDGLCANGDALSCLAHSTA